MAFTYFFRDMQALELISRDALPILRGHKYINIWDAGCAHGPEPYSLAIVLRENMSRMLFRNISIFATDIDNSNQFGSTITEAVYPYDQIKRIPAQLRDKYFTETSRPDFYRVSDEIRSRVSFIKHDLLSLKPPRTGFSLILCKNVLLHFNQQQRVDVIRMFHSVLRQGGFFVTEQTQKLPHQAKGLFEQVASEGQVFRRAEVSEPESVLHNRTI